MEKRWLRLNESEKSLREAMIVYWILFQNTKAAIFKIEQTWEIAAGDIDFFYWISVQNNQEMMINGSLYIYIYIYIYMQGDQKVSVHLMITVQKTRKNILNSFNHLPW
jgi:hypothetical protein